MAFLDATAVQVALPSIGRELDASLSGLQWTITSYTLTLASLILLGGSLGDRYGRRRVFLIGVVWFAAASLICGVAQNVEQLVAARALQGVGGALLTPGSLALIQSSFRPRGPGAGDRPVVRPGRHRGPDRAVPRRGPRRRRELAAGLPHQRAVRGASSSPWPAGTCRRAGTRRTTAGSTTWARCWARWPSAA